VREVGKAPAAGQRFEQYAPDLYRFLLRFIRRPHDAEDVRQEVFARLSRIADHTLARDPKAYLFGIAFHVLREFRMRERRERVAFDSEMLHQALEKPDDLQSDDLGEQLDIQQQLERALERLPPRERAVLLLVKRDGMSYVEAARVAGLSVHQVERHVINARARLKDMLSDR
jgi:RNA polymerase sigma factor (sigma-70 family)